MLNVMSSSPSPWPTHDALGPAPKHLLHLLLHIARLLDERLRGPLARVGVHHGQGRVLDALLRQGPLTVSELAAGLRIAQPTATVMAQRMQSAGLLERWIDPEDARRVTLTLTPRGRGAAQAVRRVWQQTEDAVCASLPAAERLRLRLLLEGLRNDLGGADPDFDLPKGTTDETLITPLSRDRAARRDPARRTAAKP